MTRAICRQALRAGCAVVVFSLIGTAHALRAGRSVGGVDYVSGGIGQDELSALHQRRAKYSLWVITAAAGTGAYLANVRIAVRDSSGRSLFDERLDGPWLFIDLPVGRYEIEARLDERVQRGVTTIHAGDRHQAFFYFDTGDEVAPGRPAPPSGNPYGGTRR